MLTHALLGYEHKKSEIEEKIREIRGRLGKGKTSYSSAAEPETAAEKPANGRKRRTLSAEARKRIATAQKKRWAEHRKNQTAAE